MTWILVLFVPPLVAIVPYRRAGHGWGRVASLTAAAFLLSLVGVAVTLLYAFGFTIEAAQCGSTPAAASATAVVAYLLVAAWAARRPRNVWAWAAAPLTAVAILLLVGYFFAGAHAYCET